MQKIYPVSILFRAPRELAEALSSVAAEEQETKSNYLRRLVRRDIERRKSERQARGDNSAELRAA